MMVESSGRHNKRKNPEGVQLAQEELDAEKFARRHYDGGSTRNPLVKGEGVV